MIITVAGEAGSGKSTICKLLAQRLEYKFYSTGDLRGEIATKHGMTIDALNVIGRTESWPHRECDDRTVEIGKTQDNIVFDSWLAWYFIPHSFKVFLNVDEDIGAQRIYANQRPDEERQDSIDGVKEMLRRRFANWHTGVQAAYPGIDFHRMKNYDVVVDASHLTQAQVVDAVFAALPHK